MNGRSWYWKGDRGIVDLAFSIGFNVYFYGLVDSADVLGSPVEALDTCLGPVVEGHPLVFGK